MAVSEDLDLDMPGAVDQALRVERPVAERARRLRRAPGEGLGDLGFAAHRAHAAPAAARHGLEHDRRLRSAEKRARIFGALHDRALDHRRARARRNLSGLDLVAEEVERLGRRPNEHEPGGHDGAGETCVLGEKAVAGMDRVAAGGDREGDDARAVEIGGRARARKRMRLVRLAQMQRGRVVLGVDRDAHDLEIGRRAGDADGNLAPVGDEELAERDVGHGGENLGDGRDL